MRKFFYAISAVCLMLMTSCSSVMSEFEEEIDDAVRLCLSAIELYVHHPYDDSAKDLVDELFDYKGSKLYKTILVNHVNRRRRNEEGNKFAKEMLRYYKNLDISLSEPVYEEPTIKGEIVLTFLEENSGINFIFYLDAKNKTYSFEFFGDEEISRYEERIKKKFINMKTDPHLAAENIENKIRNLYDEIFSGNFEGTSNLMSQEFDAITDLAGEVSDGYMWIDCNIWTFSQDYEGMEIFELDVDVQSSTNAIVNIELSTVWGEDIRIKMYMVYENEDWYVDDIYNLNRSLSVKQRALETCGIK